MACPGKEENGGVIAARSLQLAFPRPSGRPNGSLGITRASDCEETHVNDLMAGLVWEPSAVASGLGRWTDCYYISVVYRWSGDRGL